MRVVFEHWKYIFRNLWFVLPFAVVPAVFLALSVDFAGIKVVADNLFSGPFDLDFVQIFHAWSFFRFDSVSGVLYSVFALICLVFFTSLLLAFVEKHMRIGKRTLSGILNQLENHISSVIFIVLLLFFLYEAWAGVLSAVLYLICSISSETVAKVLFVEVSLLFIAILLYLITIVYLWLPCRLQTGFGLYSSFLYSYRLVMGVRFKLYLSFAITYIPCFLVLFFSALGPHWLSRLIAIVLYLFGYLSFCVRMESLYFYTDKLDREDLLRSYREL